MIKELNLAEEMVFLGVLNLFCSESLEEWKEAKGFNLNHETGEALALLMDLADEMESKIYGITVDSSEYNDLAESIENVFSKHNYQSKYACVGAAALVKKRW